MRKTGEKYSKAEEISFNISSLPATEIRALFEDLPFKSLKRWLNYYVEKEQYEICQIIKEHIDNKTKQRSG